MEVVRKTLRYGILGSFILFLIYCIFSFGSIICEMGILPFMNRKVTILEMLQEFPVLIGFLIVSIFSTILFWKFITFVFPEIKEFFYNIWFKDYMD